MVGAGVVGAAGDVGEEGLEGRGPGRGSVQGALPHRVRPRVAVESGVGAGRARRLLQIQVDVVGTFKDLLTFVQAFEQSSVEVKSVRKPRFNSRLPKPTKNPSSSYLDYSNIEPSPRPRVSPWSVL